jgi:hypothetical protein
MSVEMRSMGMKSRLYYVYIGSGLLVGLALGGISLARGLLVGVVAGMGWSAICVGRLVIGSRPHRTLPNESQISRLLASRRDRHSDRQ